MRETTAADIHREFYEPEKLVRESIEQPRANNEDRKGKTGNPLRGKAIKQ